MKQKDNFSINNRVKKKRRGGKDQQINIGSHTHTHIVDLVVVPAGMNAHVAPSLMPEVGQKQLSTLPGGPTGYDQTPGTRTPSPCTKISPGVIQQLVPITTDRASGADSDAPETVQLIITEYKMQTAVTYRGVSKPRG